MANKPTYEELEKRVKELEDEAIDRKKSEGALTGREESFLNLFRFCPMGMHIYKLETDGSLKFQNANKAADDILGVSCHQFIGKPIEEAFPPLSDTEVPARYRDAAAKGKMWETEHINYTHGDLSGAFKVVAFQTKPNEMATIFEDITKRKRAENALRESKQFLDAIFDSIQDGISVLDPELNIVRVNQAMREWFAHMLPLEGRKCYEAYIGRTKACTICPALRALDSGRLEMDEIPLPRAGGVTGTVELFSFPMLDDSGKPTGIVEYVRDITKRKRAEEVLKESAEKIKLFAYSVSHDIKNPAVGIYLLTKYLNENYKGILDEKGKSHCDHIMKASEELATLVERINVYISTKESPLEIERVNLNQVFDTVRDECSVQILVRQISWSQPENLLEINVDRISILRVIRNFVDNALKYGGDELSEINIGYEESDGFHILSVKDDGIGIAEKDSRKIFSPFERSVTSTGIQGTGLGLAIAHEIAYQHKGKVWTELGPEKGIIFYISISKNLKLTK